LRKRHAGALAKTEMPRDFFGFSPCRIGICFAQRIGMKKGNSMTSEAPSWDDYVATSARALGFSLEPSWKEGVRENIKVIFRIAGAVDSFELPDDIEPAPVFEA
jgi:hypothetical protein